MPPFHNRSKNWRTVDQLVKIRLVLDLFSNTIDIVYYLEKELSLDKPVVLQTGNYGVKLYMLTELSALILHILVYTGQCNNLGGKRCDAN
jgi:hypothetical protein